jgi:GNAT superfamily N-acetyltransferase
MSAPYWTIRQAGPNDLDALMHLVRTVHGERYPQINARYWRWRYHGHAGFPASVFIAEHRGEVIGLRPTMIFDYWWGADQFKGAMYTGVMTHPEHRRRGVFRSLVDAANDHVARAGAAFCLTLPNDMSLPGFRAAPDWHYPGVIPAYVKPIDTPLLLRRKAGKLLSAVAGRGVAMLFRQSVRQSNIGSIRCTPVETFPDALTDVAADFARDAGNLMLARTAPYMNWRFTQHPHLAYHLQVAHDKATCVGAIVTATAEQSGLPVGMIVDLVARGGTNTLSALLHAGEKVLRDDGVALITCQASTPLLQRALRQCGFRRLPNRLVPKRFNFVYRLTGAAALPAEPRRLSAWHLTFGDSDNA